jgi:hypothetical protein
MTDQIHPADDNAIVWYRDKRGKQRAVLITKQDAGTYLLQDGTGIFVCVRNVVYPVHSDDGPAIIRDRKKLKRYPQIPAIVFANKGKIHRADGPAVIMRDDQKEFYLHGVELLEHELAEIRGQNLDFELTEGALKFFKSGTRTFHRIGGPAIIGATDGGRYQTHYIDGKLRREDDKPVHVSTDEEGVVREFWFSGGQLHRITGPAINCSNGTPGVLHRWPADKRGRFRGRGKEVV